MASRLTPSWINLTRNWYSRKSVGIGSGWDLVEFWEKVEVWHWVEFWLQVETITEETDILEGGLWKVKIWDQIGINLSRYWLSRRLMKSSEIWDRFKLWNWVEQIPAETNMLEGGLWHVEVWWLSWG